jgi:antirestriction protein ArdC
MSRFDVYQAVTDRIIAALEAGTVPWHKPWTGGGPQNVKNGRLYRGINVWLLEMMAYGDPRWGTYKAIEAAGGQVRKGQHGTAIVLWKRVPKKPKPGEEDEHGSYFLLRYYNVFNAEQCDGFDPYVHEHDWEPIERAQEIVYEYAPGPSIGFGGSSAYYSPSNDHVQVPELNQFESPESYYSALYHELVHSTGHKSRLDRLEATGFGSGPYAKEELVAEMGSAMLQGIVGLDPPEQDMSAAYIANWLERLQNDHKLVVQAAAKAQAAVDLILGTTFEDSDSYDVRKEAVPA